MAPIFGLIGLIGALVAGVGCQTKPVAELQPQIRRIAIMPVQNLSGRDLQQIPAVLWEQADTVRLLTRLAESTAPLIDLPFEAGQLPFDDLAVPADSHLRTQLRYESTAKQLVWREQMTAEDRDELLRWSDSPNWQYAVQELFAQSTGEHFDADASLRRELVAELRRQEFVVIDASDQTKPIAPDAAPAIPTTTAATTAATTTDWTATDAAQSPTYREKLRAVAMATKANAVLTLAVESWDWTYAFDASEITISLTAVVSDPADGKLLWQRTTGAVRCKLPPGLRYGSSFDLRQAYPQFVSQLIRLLLA